MTIYFFLNIYVYIYTVDSPLHDYRDWLETHEIEMLVNIVYMYSSYGLPIIGISTYKEGGSMITDA